MAEAKVYVVVDKDTGILKGTVEISDEAISEWTKKYTVKEAGEDFRGKHPHEIKIENGKTRHATNEEIDTYNQQTENETKSARKKKALEDLGLTNADLAKIKAL